MISETKPKRYTRDELINSWNTHANSCRQMSGEKIITLIQQLLDDRERLLEKLEEASDMMRYQDTFFSYEADELIKEVTGDE